MENVNNDHIIKEWLVELKKKKKKKKKKEEEEDEQEAKY